jgi:hypothetical protein
LVKKVKKKATKKKKPVKGVKIQITILKNVPKNKEFVLADGRKLKDLKELAFALGDMADDVFWHHVNDAKNDFSNWVNSVIKDKELSEELTKIKDKVNAQITVLKHIVKKI